MRWILPLVLLLNLRAVAQQSASAMLDLMTRTSETVDVFSFTDPDFGWDMGAQVQVELNEGINYLKEGSPDVAVGHLDKALEKDPQLWVAHYYKGICLKLQKQYSTAARSLMIANGLHRDNYLILLELGKVADLSKKPEEAEKYFEASAKLNPASAVPVYYLGNHFFSMGNIDGARKYYNKALSIDPMMLDAEVKLGLLEIDIRIDSRDKMRERMESVLMKDSLHKQALVCHAIATIETDPETSIKNWNTLVRLSPGNLIYRALRVPINIKAERYDKAFSDLRKMFERFQENENGFSGDQSVRDKIISLGYAGSYVMMNIYGLSDSDAALVRRAFCLLYAGNYERALESLNEVTDPYGSALIIFLKAMVFEFMGKHDRAYAAYNAALKLDDDIIDAHKKRGIYRMEMKQWALAENDFRKMLFINDNAIFAYQALGLCRYNEGDYKAAIDEFSEYLELDASNNEVRAYRGMAYQKDKQLLAATLDFLISGKHHAVEPFPDIRKELDIILASKDTAVVIDWLKMFSDAAPTYAHANKYLIELYIASGRWADVELIADRELSRQPVISMKDESQLAAMKGTSLIYQKKPEAAVGALDRAIKLNKNNSLAYLSRGKAYLKLNNRAAATRDLKKAETLGEKEATRILSSLQ